MSDGRNRETYDYQLTVWNSRTFWTSRKKPTNHMDPDSAFELEEKEHEEQNVSPV